MVLGGMNGRGAPNVGHIARVIPRNERVYIGEFQRIESEVIKFAMRRGLRPPFWVFNTHCKVITFVLFLLKGKALFLLSP